MLRGIAAATAQSTGAIPESSLGQPGGPAGPLTPAGQIPAAQIPVSPFVYQGDWDASTNTPTLADGTGTAGHAYLVDVAGSQDLGSGTLNFNVGDAVVYDGSVWDQIPHGGQLFVQIGGNSVASTMDIGTTTEQDVRILQGGDPLITVRSNGVGIAWPTPMAPLHIGGGIIIEAGSVQFEIDLSDGTQAKIGTAATDPLTFITNNTTRLTIEGSGQLTAASGYTPTGAKSLVPKDYVDGAVFSGAYGDLTGVPIAKTGSVTLQLTNGELIWPSAISNGKIRLWNTTPGSNNTFYGLGIGNGELIYQVDQSASSHVFQSVDGSDNAVEICRFSTDGGIVSSVDLHMGEQKIINLGNPSSARDGVNLQTLDARLSPAQRTAIDALTSGSSAAEIVAALQAT